MNITSIKSLVKDQQLLEIIEKAEFYAERDNIPVTNILRARWFVRRFIGGREWSFDDFRLTVETVKIKRCRISEVYTGDSYSHEIVTIEKTFEFIVCKVKTFKMLSTKLFLEGSTTDSTEFKNQKIQIRKAEDELVQYLGNFVNEPQIDVQSPKHIKIISGVETINILLTDKSLLGLIIKVDTASDIIESMSDFKLYQLVASLSDVSVLANIREMMDRLNALTQQLRRFTSELSIDEINEDMSDEIRLFSGAENNIGQSLEWQLNKLDSLSASKRTLSLKQVSKVIFEIRITNESDELGRITEYYYRFKNLRNELPNIVGKVNRLYTILI